VTAQVDGGDNRPLGWGPELGVTLERDEGGWFASAHPPAGAPINVRYQGANRFMVKIGGRFSDVHQGDPASVHAADGSSHQLILRRYRDRPNDRAAAPAPREQSAQLGARLGAAEAELAEVEAEAEAEAAAEDLG
jgi:hypothetical protein